MVITPVKPIYFRPFIWGTTKITPLRTGFLVAKKMNLWICFGMFFSGPGLFDEASFWRGFWCLNGLVHMKVGETVGKYSISMEHLGIYIFMYIYQ